MLIGKVVFWFRAVRLSFYIHVRILDEAKGVNQENDNLMGFEQRK